MPSSSPRSRVALLLAGLLAVGAVALLLLGDLGGEESDEVRREESVRPEAAPLRGGPDASAPAGSGATLTGLYGEGDLGAVRLRLVRPDDSPVRGQEVRLLARAGAATALASGEDGSVLFGRVPPGRGYRVEVEGEGFSPVVVQGVSVRPAEPTDLGDIVLAPDFVVQGRVIDASGNPIEGARVAAFATDRRMALQGIVAYMYEQATVTPEPLDGAVTDERGHFVLARLGAGVHHLVVRRAGFATRFQADVVVGKDRAARSLTIVLSDGARVRGRVTDEDGKAIPGAEVVALRDFGMRFEPNSVVEKESVRTEENGRYEIDTLTRGSGYRFGVIAKGYSVLFETSPTEVEVEMERDFVLPRAGALEGTVSDKATGEPIAGAVVLVIAGQMGFGPGGRGGSERVTPGQATTDAEGRFRIEGLEAGPISMAQVRASGYATLGMTTFTGGSWGDITPGETLSVPVLLERGGAVSGTLANAATGDPVAGATVSVVPRDQPWMVFMTGAASGVSDPEGRFRIEGVRPGNYGLVASAPGFVSPEPTNESVAVTVPESGGEVTAALKLTAAGAVHGTVRDAAGEPVAGARVRTRAAPAEGQGRGGRRMPGWRSFLPGAVNTDLTDQDGRYRLEGIPAGERLIAVVESDEHTPGESVPFQVDSGGSREVDLVLVGGGRIEGRVVDDQGRFLKGARVRVGTLSPEDAARRNLSAWQVDRFLDPRVLFTDEEGRFLATNVAAGRVVVKVEMEGFVVHYRRDLEVRPDQTVANHVVALSRGEVVEGTVRDESGRPIEGALVAVSTRRNPGPGDDDAEGTGSEDSVEPQMTGRSDRDGRFRVENVAPGRAYSVLVWFAPGHLAWGQGRAEASIRREVQVPARDLEFRLAPAPEGTGAPGPRPPAPSGVRPPGR
jgi:protocatechuate 3,4-dioxygenase beta subunit